MFIFKKILSHFILPPGIFILILFFLGMSLLFKKMWKNALIVFLIASSLWLFSIKPFSDFLYTWLESDLNIPKTPKGDVIILLSGGVYDKALDFSGKGIPKEDTMHRIITAVSLQKQLKLPIIVSGGRIYKYSEAEAPIIKRYLIDFGVPSNKIILEDKSRDTTENVKFSALLCKKMGFKRPILVTSAYHMKRSLLGFEKSGLDVLPFPSKFMTGLNKRYTWSNFMPDASELRRTYIAMHEYLGLFAHKLALL